MKSRWSNFCLFALLGAFLAPAPASADTCTGRISNPVVDVCWKCAFPMTIGGATVSSFGQEDFTELAVSSAGCFCPKGGVPVPGIAVSFWEPVRMVDVTTKPYCMVSLGGVTMATGVHANAGHKASRTGDAIESHHSSSFYHVHYFIYPLNALMNIYGQWVCSAGAQFDLAYMTELDPLWSDDELMFVLAPESLLFANALAQSACAADCAAASAGFPLTPLFWCAGCQGSMYPLTGNITQNDSNASGVAASVLLVERMLYKLHRQGLAQGTIGAGALCVPYAMPILTKGQYKTQLLYPIPETAGSPAHPYCCQPLGRSTMLWGLGKEYPVKGEDFSYLIWRKRDCCAF